MIIGKLSYKEREQMYLGNNHRVNLEEEEEPKEHPCTALKTNTKWSEIKDHNNVHKKCSLWEWIMEANWIGTN